MAALRPFLLPTLSLSLFLVLLSFIMPIVSSSSAKTPPTALPLFTGINHLSKECTNPEAMTIWLQHPSGLVMHLIEGEKETYKLREGPARNAETGTRAEAHPFTQGSLDPIHIRRGHHQAWNVQSLDKVKEELKKRGIPYGESQVPGRNVQQLFFYDVEGGGVECVYTPPTEEKQEL